MAVRIQVGMKEEGLASAPGRTRAESGVRSGGLTEEEAAASRARWGQNRLTRRKSKGFLRCFAASLWDPVTRILLLALGFNLALSFHGADWTETVGIAASVLLATTVSAASEASSEAAFERLRAECERETCHVLRGGTVRELPWEEVAVGDEVLLSPGEHIPADGVLIAGNLTVEQAALTGESGEVEKTGCHPWEYGRIRGESGENPTGFCTASPGDGFSLFRGSGVSTGEGRMVVTAVGDATALGSISREVQEEVRDSPLKLRLAGLAGQISRLGYVAAALVAGAFLFNEFVMDSGFRQEVIWLKLTNIPYLLSTLLNGLMLALTVMIVAVPEGLPMMVAVVLSANTRRMAKDNVLVRRPAGIEAAGSMDILFTDKTGTLTEGKLSVGACADGDGRAYDTPAVFLQQPGARAELFLAGCRLGGPETGGNSTDRALAALAEEIGADAGKGWRVTDRLPFDSGRKYAAVTLADSAGKTFTLVRGAPEWLLPGVKEAFSPAGEKRRFDCRRVTEQIEAWGREGKRVLLMGTAPGSCRSFSPEHTPLTFLTALVLTDRMRPEAPAAVADLQEAGVQVVMITGDSAATGSAIARQCGILREGGVVLTGSELSALSDLQLRELLPRLAVVARALPADKSRLVRVAEEEERVVGMTGDGINDAPALRRADIGFAMGSGTAVAREAGDILLLDDNLATVARAVRYGHGIFGSIRKFITLQLTMNLCAVAVTMLGPFLGVDEPVTVVQMLWINLIMDTLGGLAFAGEASPALAGGAGGRKLRPLSRREPILSFRMVHEILLLGGYTVALLLWFLRSPALRGAFRSSSEDIVHLTAFFALFIFASVFNCFNARADGGKLTAGLTRNRPFCLIMTAVLGVQILFVYLGGNILRTVPLTGRELLFTAVLALTVLPAEGIRRFLWHLFHEKRKNS